MGAELAESTPDVFKDVGFDQRPGCILHFQVVFDDPSRARISGTARTPTHRFVKVVATDFKITTGVDRRTTAEKNVFTSCLEEVVDDLVGAGDSCNGIVVTRDGL